MCKILMEDSFQNMYNNTLNRSTTDRKGNSQRVQVTTTMFIPSVNNSSLEIRAKTRSTGQAYNSYIYFENVEYVDEGTPGAISIEGVDGAAYHLMPIPRSNNVKVNCQCLDFYWTFAVYNDNRDSLFGDAPDPYAKKTQRPPRNPAKVPGMCKHLLEFFQTIINDKIIK